MEYICLMIYGDLNAIIHSLSAAPDLFRSLTALHKLITTHKDEVSEQTVTIATFNRLYTLLETFMKNQYVALELLHLFCRLVRDHSLRR